MSNIKKTNNLIIGNVTLDLVDDEARELIEGLRSDAESDIADIRSDVSEDIADIRSDVESDISVIDARVDNLVTDVSGAETVTLWNGSMSADGGTYTLSESVSGFDFIDIYYDNVNTGVADYLRIPASKTSAAVYIPFFETIESSNKPLEIGKVALTFSGTSVTVAAAKQYFWDGTSEGNATILNAQLSFPVRIDGVKSSASVNAELADVRVGADGVTYGSAGAAVRGQITNANANVAESFNNYDIGHKKIADTFRFGTLDSNGDIIAFSNNSRCVSIEYYTAISGDILTLDSGFLMILCEYDSNQTLLNRGVKASGDYSLTAGNLYRVTIFDSNGTIQSTPYDYAFKAHLQTNADKRFGAVEASMVIESSAPNVVYHYDGYVNSSTNTIYPYSTSTTLFYSDLVEVKKGESVTVNFRNTLDVVWILSEWSDNNTFVAGILKGNSNEGVQSYSFIATKDMYIRHSAAYLNDLTVKSLIDENYNIIKNALSDELNSVDYGYLLNSFLKIGAVGDSLASGECISGTKNGVTVANDLYEHSWLQYMARFYGFTGVNLSKGGMTARGWLFDDDYNQQGWTKAQIADNLCNAYIIGIGANDIALYLEDSSYLGTPSDIGTTNPTFYRYYAQIISRLKSIQPKAKFFLFTLTWLYTETAPYDTVVDDINEAITYIANNTENCYLINLEEDRWYYGTDNTGNKRSGHYNAIGYNMQAMHLAKLIGKYMHDHQDAFRQIEFIGTDLSWAE